MKRVIKNAMLPVLTITLVSLSCRRELRNDIHERLGRAQVLDHVQQQHVIELSRIDGNSPLSRSPG